MVDNLPMEVNNHDYTIKQDQEWLFQFFNQNTLTFFFYCFKIHLSFAVF